MNSLATTPGAESCASAAKVKAAISGMKKHALSVCMVLPCSWFGLPCNKTRARVNEPRRAALPDRRPRLARTDPTQENSPPV
jgi:hypothetical protein